MDHTRTHIRTRVRVIVQLQSQVLGTFVLKLVKGYIKTGNVKQLGLNYHRSMVDVGL